MIWQARGGSGEHAGGVQLYKRIAKMWKKLPLPTNNRRLNTNRDIRPIANAIPPHMLNQLGGLVGLQNMMKQMGAQSR